MDDLEALQDIEAIKQLKARYCRLLDTKQWDAWRDIFTDDFVGDQSASGGKRTEGGDAFVAFVKNALNVRHTVHQVHAPEISLVSSDDATGIWALEDWVRFARGFNLHGYGHYHEIYRKVDGHWRIASSTLTRTREEILTPLGTVYFTDKLRARLAFLGDRIMAE